MRLACWSPAFRGDGLFLDRPVELKLGISASKRKPLGKFATAARRRQHARRVRYPEFFVTSCVLEHFLDSRVALENTPDAVLTQCRHPELNRFLFQND